MNTFVALFRGINVGGHNKLPMGELKKVLDALGLRKIETYIQSGNVVFESEEADVPALSGRICEAVSRSHGFAPKVLLLRADEIEGVIASNPYPEAESEPKSLHVFFLEEDMHNPDLEKLDEVKKESERYALLGRAFYLHAPEGIGRSKLAERVEKALGVAVTARNWRSVTKIMAMAKR
jgi:uncharacterized protein (DUF1697 family)